MADAVVEFLLDNLKQLLLYNSDLICGVKGQVDSLYKELSLMKAFLKDSKEKRSEYEYIRELVRQIRDVAYEAEDTIDTFVVNAAMQKERSTLSKIVHAFDYPAKLRSVAKDIESIKTKVKEIYDKKMFGIEALYAGESSNRFSSQRRKPMVEEDNVVGFDEEAKEIVSRLTNISESLEVVSVVGMGGLGKTTLAKKVYCNPTIEFRFFVRAWVYVSQEYNRKEVLFAILSSLMQPSDQTFKMNEEMLVQEICKQLNGRRYLIVLDDVWTTDAWDDLKMAFPNQDCGSRILLTSRNTDVAVLANPDSPPHHLRFLNDDESWELLSTKVFRRGSCPSELVELGRTIARKCYGLPLAIVVVAGLLLKKDKTRDLWKKVAESVSSYVARDPKQCLDVLALSYKHLPDHLKVCFIYFGAFPEDFPIPVWKLLMLWVAEGFIQQVGQDCLEDTAEEYLEDLVERNLILVAKKRSNGKIKTCRVHDMLRDLCLREAAEEKFLQVIKGHIHDANSQVSSGNYHRRLCVHSHVLNFIHSKPYGPHVRSFLCFPVEEKELSREHTSFIHEAFKLVRVLDMRSINISRFPVVITQLVHLRYVALFGNFKVLPPSISKLWSLQTLIVETTSRDLDIQVDIWKMSQFRNLRTSGSSRLHGPQAKTRMDNEDPFVQRNIQTISTVSPDSCTENVLARTPNLRKLGIRGKLVLLMEKNKGYSLFDNLAKLDKLEKLKLLNDTFPRPPSEGKLRGLPPLYTFPPHLKKLTFSDTLLDWKHMSTIGMLPNLEVLKLKVYAFKGPQWEPRAGEFRLLKVLQLGKSDLVHWMASAHHFPRLQHLVVEHCTNLLAIPHGLADVSALQTMELYHTPSAVDSARLIQQQKQMQQQQQQHVKSNGFKLLIYPPE
ncbi:disease resistance protein RPP13-like [Cynara cardunculus var. scolymus]|uniref:Disease resistance protein n=1 Tax=Cynara cardunculus var. scolymus TaxID=59895 RepID=A0A118JXS4_CYNCS|nr:disease resistance protein RPP13-like [Cynara cardunculus var. scolymus]XP_024993455.1 disease resistance protein RPP13-like [Cynara cardunculus var. scolymus]KVH96369.1 Disease resistance protein [Cynara cardunculus var. scolymus]